MALLGDLAFLHDVSGLVNLPELPCTFVVLDNGGGGIFSFLPQAGSVQPSVFEQLFGTPPTSDMAAVARGFGLPVHDVTASRSSSRLWPRQRPRWSGSWCRAGRRMSRCTMRSTRRSARAAIGVGEGVEAERRPVGLWKVSSTLAHRDLPSHLVHTAVMLVGELGEVV